MAQYKQSTAKTLRTSVLCLRLEITSAQRMGSGVRLSVDAPARGYWHQTCRSVEPGVECELSLLYVVTRSY